MIEFLIAWCGVMAFFTLGAWVSDYLIPWLEKRWEVRFK